MRIECFLSRHSRGNSLSTLPPSLPPARASPVPPLILSVSQKYKNEPPVYQGKSENSIVHRVTNIFLSIECLMWVHRRLISDENSGSGVALVRPE